MPNLKKVSVDQTASALRVEITSLIKYGGS
jgi:hypothetical protein